MPCFVVLFLMSTFLEIIHKEQLGKKEKINFQNTVNTITKRQTKLELVFLYFHLKEIQNQDSLLSGLFAYLFWSRKGMLGHQCWLFSYFPEKEIQVREQQNLLLQMQLLKGCRLEENISRTNCQYFFPPQEKLGWCLWAILSWLHIMYNIEYLLESLNVSLSSFWL